MPDYVIESVNNLLAAKMELDGSVTLRQNEIIKAIRAHAKFPEGMTTQELFDNNYLDIEPYYRKAGWTVTYDKPAYNETYEASFEFKPKRRK